MNGTLAIQQAKDTDATFKQTTDDAMLMWLNSAQEQIYSVMVSRQPMKYAKKEDVNIVAGTSVYPLPSDFMNINFIESTGAGGLFVYDSEGIIMKEYETTCDGSSEDGYFIAGGNINITPVPTEAVTATISYIPEITKLTSTGDDLFTDDNDAKYQEFYPFHLSYKSESTFTKDQNVMRNFLAQRDAVLAGMDSNPSMQILSL